LGTLPPSRRPPAAHSSGRRTERPTLTIPEAGLQMAGSSSTSSVYIKFFSIPSMYIHANAWLSCRFFFTHGSRADLRRSTLCMHFFTQ
ncbi:hypothetical protein BAE44_0015214, partial [Dichanthelium oligosanthes]